MCGTTGTTLLSSENVESSEVENELELDERRSVFDEINTRLLASLRVRSSQP